VRLWKDVTPFYTGGEDCTDGGGPVGGRIQAANGDFYGTTASGGANYAGTVYKLTPGGALI
jgi:uncharacterized repeat protein (TIGR03803 family)